MREIKPLDLLDPEDTDDYQKFLERCRIFGIKMVRTTSYAKALMLHHNRKCPFFLVKAEPHPDPYRITWAHRGRTRGRDSYWGHTKMVQTFYYYMAYTEWNSNRRAKKEFRLWLLKAHLRRIKTTHQRQLDVLETHYAELGITITRRRRRI